MRWKFLLVIGICVGSFYCPPMERFERGKLHTMQWSLREAYSELYLPPVVNPPVAGQFAPEVVEMFHVIFPMDYSGNYYEPDSTNTRIYYLDSFLSEEPDQIMVLIETSAGYPGGSCGLNIKAGWYYPYEEKWEQLAHDCGVIDTVHSLRHSGCHDFTTSDKWGQNKVRYQFDGTTYQQHDELKPLNDTDQIVKIMNSELPYKDRDYVREFIVPDLHWNYVNLDSTNNLYLFLQCSMDGLFLVHEDKPGEWSLVNFFKQDVDLDILNTVHNGFPDIRTFNLNYVYNIYRWNGSKYILHHTEEWVCPA